MGTLADMICLPAQRTRAYAERLLKDVRPDQFARQPLQGSARIVTNHPAFVFGHLALYPETVATVAGLDPAPHRVPAGWSELFKDGVECRDDASGSIYPAMPEIVDAYMRGYDAVIARVLALSDADLQRPNGIERYRERFPAAGTGVNFLLNNHPMMHLGQVSAWRRAMGLGPA